MPLTNNELEVLVARLRKEFVPLSKLDPSGAEDGDVVTFNGSTWEPRLVAVDPNGTALRDTDNRILLDLDLVILTEREDVGFRYLDELTLQQSLPSMVWTFTHNQAKEPTSVSVVDVNGREVVGRVEHSDSNTTRIRFGRPIAGVAKMAFRM